LHREAKQSLKIDGLLGSQWVWSVYRFTFLSLGPGRQVASPHSLASCSSYQQYTL